MNKNQENNLKRYHVYYDMLIKYRISVDAKNSKEAKRMVMEQDGIDYCYEKIVDNEDPIEESIKVTKID